MKTVSQLFIASLASSLLILSLAPASLSAEEIRVPIAKQGSSDVKVPKKGMSKAQVQKAFGEAESVSAAVGEPPISKWEYQGFSVYFEYDHVIHAVVHPKKS